MKKYYEFTFENGDIYTGTVDDKNEFCKHLTKDEKSTMGKIVSKKAISEEQYNSYMETLMDFIDYL